MIGECENYFKKREPPRRRLCAAIFGGQKTNPNRMIIIMHRTRVDTPNKYTNDDRKNFGSIVYDIIYDGRSWRAALRDLHTDNLTVRIVCSSDGAVSCKCAVISCSTCKAWWRFNNIVWNLIREKRFIYMGFRSSFGAQQLFSVIPMVGEHIINCVLLLLLLLLRY